MAYAQVGNISDAASSAGVSRSRHYDWLSDPDYAEAFHQAKEQAADRLEREAVRRATQGVDKGVYYRGEKVGTERTYSDVLLIFLLKGLRPEKYRDTYGATQQVLVNTGPMGQAVPERTPDQEEELAMVLRHTLVASDRERALQTTQNS